MSYYHAGQWHAHILDEERDENETCAQCGAMVAPDNVQWAMATPYCPPCFMGNH